MRLGILTSHPIQYHAPWFRALAEVVDLEVFFCHRQTAAEQGRAGFGVAFDWDVDLLSGYKHRFLKNVSRNPGVNQFFGCDTPEVAGIVGEKMENGRWKIGEETTDPSPGQRPSSPRRTGRGTRRRFDAFIVTGWNLKSYWQAVRTCRRAGVPVLVRGDSQLHTPRSWLKRWAKEILYRPLLRQFDGFLVVGQRNREYLAHYGVPKDKMFFAPHFVDNQWFAAKAAEVRSQKIEDRRSKLENSSSAQSPISHLPSPTSFVVLFVGKFIPKKRPADLLRAISAFSFQLSAFNITAVFVGSGELESELRALAARENLRVHFAGFKNQSELPACYAVADVLVLPSESETWGLAVNEGMACGLPAIVSDAVGCAPDLIEEGKTGFTYPVGDCAQLARRLESLAEMKARGHDFAPALAEKMSAYSVERAVRGTVEGIKKLKAKSRK